MESFPWNPKALGLPTTEEEADAINDEFDMKILRDLSSNYNLTADDVNRIDLNRVKTKLEYIISLWQREVAIPAHLTFGEPYDSVFKLYVLGNHLTNDFIDDDENLGSISIDNNRLYVMLNNPEIMMGFLSSSINLSTEFYGRNENTDESDANIAIFNTFWTKLAISNNISIKTYDDFCERITDLSDIDLAYIAICCQIKAIYNDRVSLYSLMHLTFRIKVE